MQQSGNNSSRIASWFTLLLGYVLETSQFYCLSAFFLSIFDDAVDWIRYQIDSYFNVILVEDLRGDNPIGRLMIGDNNGDICLFITFFPWDDW